MDVTSYDDITEGGVNKNQSECILNQPTANGTLPHPSRDRPLAEEATPPLSVRSEDDDSDDVINITFTNDIAGLLSTQHASELQKLKGVDTSVSPPPPPHSTNQNNLSTSKSHASLHTDAAHIKEVAGDDCCVHCLLACLFCELLSMFSALGECLACGVGGAGCCDAVIGCCCVEAAGEAACTEEACQAVLDCGMLEGCCGSADCLEICLECCSICFPS